MVVCGVNNVNLLDSQNTSQWRAIDLLSDSFSTLAIYFEDLDSKLKYHSDLTITQGQIILL